MFIRWLARLFVPYCRDMTGVVARHAAASQGTEYRVIANNLLRVT
jgi:hypothetical protein